MTKSTTATLMVTMVALKRALSLMPITRIAVITSAMMKAGRLTPISYPKRCGASEQSRVLSATTPAIARP